jgi:hypothetical protein
MRYELSDEAWDIAANYLAFVQLASIRLWLRVYEFTTCSFWLRGLMGAVLIVGAFSLLGTQGASAQQAPHTPGRTRPSRCRWMGPKPARGV